MKKTLTYFLIICLITSVLPIGIGQEFDKKDSPVQFSETTIDMSTACKPVKEMCKLLTLMKMQIEPADVTPTVSVRPAAAKKTHRKIIHFESNGELEDPCR
jgi:hypothetical protein